MHLPRPPRLIRPEHRDHLPFLLQPHFAGVLPREQPQGALRFQALVLQGDGDPLRNGTGRLADTRFFAHNGRGWEHHALAGGAGGGEVVRTGEERVSAGDSE